MEIVVPSKRKSSSLNAMSTEHNKSSDMDNSAEEIAFNDYRKQLNSPFENPRNMESTSFGLKIFIYEADEELQRKIKLVQKPAKGKFRGFRHLGENNCPHYQESPIVSFIWTIDWSSQNSSYCPTVDFPLGDMFHRMRCSGRHQIIAGLPSTATS